ncbi:30S ribosomal protein S12 methylthiotransferase RimO [[Clostridium] polysaccharolyticum]|uniref:Ribosomal protein uS12 methylthiotransferase RimO n=1 Tax=[Clostridium] polysaccharolyticum TaxID=29364 RepID=A0A1I0ADA9_9FIRM|nr:30S ribosomal protein S12 methylthiotransferase RimO [[Clostridium] polysaccharolyticum]SES92171.1 SSU ribosomal protein S12P methylthiotransferase [[Clostridium] polysaccharolyticum]
MKILFISLGCDKNLVDSEVMLGLIRERAFELTDDEKEADVIVVNTCCFVNDAKEESINTILEMAELKKTGKLKALIAAGCLAQRYRKEIEKEIPEIDAIIGTTGYEDIVSAIENALSGTKSEYFKDLSYLPDTKHKKRVNTTGGYYSYLKIAEGCDKNCTYCIIPKIRGSYRSVPMEDLIEEAKQLVESGVVELMLVAQETTLYGVDLYGRKMLPTLLKELCRISGLQWIRILYCYPEEITDELIEAIKTEDKVCNYLDIPIQHGADRILKRMGRRTNKQELIDIVTKLRNNIPDITLRTTLITGFPGETEEEHEELIRFVEDMKFDRLGVFTYSPEENTPAALLKDHIDEEVKERRRNELMEVQQEIAFEHAQNAISAKLKVLIEGKLPEENVFIGRTYKDAPNVDGYIFVNSSSELISGQFVDVFVTDAKEYDLIGEVIWE